MSGVKISKKTFFESNIKIHPSTSIQNSKIGKGTYVGTKSKYDNCEIGRFCSIAPFSGVIYGSHPTSKYVTTHPAFFSTLKQAGFSFVKENKFRENRFLDEEKKVSVKIGNDVWIGEGVKILEGCSIGDGAIIGANSLVTKNIDPFTINIGQPTKVLKYRFNKEQVEFLLNFKWWDKEIEWIELNRALFENIEVFMKSHKTE